jgi:hypothetical protein
VLCGKTYSIHNYISTCNLKPETKNLKNKKPQLFLGIAVSRYKKWLVNSDVVFFLQ